MSIDKLYEKTCYLEIYNRGQSRDDAVFIIYSKGNDIGYAEWHNSKNRCIFYPNRYVMMDARILEDLTDFLVSETRYNRKRTGYQYKPGKADPGIY